MQTARFALRPKVPGRVAGKVRWSKDRWRIAVRNRSRETISDVASVTDLVDPLAEKRNR